MATKHDVIRVHKLHPTWPAGDIAVKLDCSSEYVRATAQRNGLRLPKSSWGDLVELGRAARLAGFTVKELRKLAEEFA